jgi:exopolysaccharide biosynthesis polyprenyl glycosylphosphotransferase
MFAGELRKQKAIFAAADSAALAAAFGIGLWLHHPAGTMETRLADADPSLLAVVMAGVDVLWILVFHSFDLYRMRNGGLREHVTVVKASSIAALLTLLVLFLAHIHIPRITVVLSYVLSMPLVQLGRATTRACLKRWYASPGIAIPLVIFGFNSVARYLLDQLLDGPTHYEPVGFLDAGGSGRQYRGYPLIGSFDALGEIAKAWPSLEAAIAMPDASREEQQRIIRLCESNRVRWWLVPWMLNSLAAGLKIDLLGTIPLIGPSGSSIAGLNFALKRGLDLVAAGALMVVAAPVIAVAAALIWLTDGSPVFFRQMRIGFHGQPFELLKLRTMHRDASDELHRQYVRLWIRGERDSVIKAGGDDGLYKLSDDRRVTPLGRVLRRFSIDELPQLVNVLRGEMSLIGPRPALPYELDLYQEWHRRRLAAAPGITGLWQVSGRNQLSFADMVQLDVKYLEDWSLAGDLKILMRTVTVLLRGSGI